MSVQDIWVMNNFVAGAQVQTTATNPKDIVNYETAQAILSGHANYKEACASSTVANIDLATGGLLVVDGYQTVEGDRILVKSQTDASQNGIYVASAGAWVRSADADENGEIVAGMTVFVHHDSEHPSNGHLYTMVSEDPIVIGTDPIAFVVSGAVVGHADDVSVNSSGWSQLTGSHVQDALTSADTKIDGILTSHAADLTKVYNAFGLADLSEDFGTFTGSTLSDNADAKTLFQELETKAEANAVIYANNKAVLTGQAIASGSWATVTHSLNDAELSSVAFFDEGNSLQNVNASVIWRPKSGDSNAIEVYQASGALKTLKIVCRV